MFLFCDHDFSGLRALHVRANAMRSEHDHLWAESKYRDGHHRYGEEETRHPRLVGRVPGIRA